MTRRNKLSMLEAGLQSSIVEVAARLGWLKYHTYNSQRSDFGYPDLTLVHEDKKRVVWMELKSDNGKTTPEQLMWLDALARCDMEVYLVFPKHLDEIIQILMLKEKPSVAQRIQYDCAVVCAQEC